MTARSRFLAEFPKAIADDAAAVFIGAGVSAGAGYPSWKELLREIGHELGVDSGDVHDLAALAQWSVRKSAGRTRVNNVIRAEIAQVLRALLPDARQLREAVGVVVEVLGGVALAEPSERRERVAAAQVAGGRGPAHRRFFALLQRE